MKRTAATAVCVACAACGPGDAGEVTAGSPRCEDLAGKAGGVRADSAGVQIVANLTPAWSTATPFALSGVPLLVIGATQGDANYEFGWLVAATVLSDGRIVAADAQASELKVFDSSGRFLQRIGRKGTGPGEYRNIEALHRTAGDTLWVNDTGSRRVTKLDPSFEPITTFAMPALSWSTAVRSPGERPLSGRTSLRLRGVLADGSLIAVASLRRVRTEEVTNSSRDSLLLYRVDPLSGRADLLSLILGARTYEYFTPDGSVYFGDAPLGHVESLAVARDRYYYGDANSFDIEERTPEGNIARRLRICEPPETIEARELDRVIREMVADLPSDDRPAEETALRGIPHPAVAPSYLQFLVDGSDRLWVRDFTFPGVSHAWRIFDRAGRWLGELRTPPAETVLAIAADRLLTRHVDDLDVHSLRVYAIEGAR